MSTAPAAYTFDTEQYCPDCIVVTLGEHQGSADTEHALDIAAHNRDIDRYSEETFDSAEFPKVILDVARCVPCATMDMHGECEPELCHACGEELWHFA